MIAAWLLLAQTSASGTYGLRVDDPTLDRPLAVEASIEPLPALLTRVGKTLGTTLTVERRMEGLKATILTPARPARLTLAGLASVFDAEWIPLRSGGYRLEETVATRNRREAYLDLETRALREAAASYLTGPFRPPELPSGGSLTEEDRQGIIDDEAETHRRMTAIYRSLPPLDREAFWTGRPVAAVTASGPAGPSSVTVAQFRVESSELAFATLVPGRYATSKRSILAEGDATALRDSSFQKAQRAWALDREAEWPRELDRPLRPITLPKPRWALATEFDRLQALYLGSGIPIVAEANRLVSGPAGLYSEPTLFEALRGLRRPSGSFRFEAGALLQRPQEFWRERLREPSEATLAPIERDDEPTLDDDAKTFAALPRTLWPTLYSRVTRRPLTTYFFQRYGLIVWGSLSDEERAAARGRDGLALAALPASTRRRIEETLLDTVLSSAGELVVPREPGQDATDETFALRLALLGLGPPRPLAVWFEADVEEILRAPWTMIAPGHGTDRRGDAVWITDAEGAGLRFFVPRRKPRQ